MVLVCFLSINCHLRRGPQAGFIPIAPALLPCQGHACVLSLKGSEKPAKTLVSASPPQPTEKALVSAPPRPESGARPWSVPAPMPRHQAREEHSVGKPALYQRGNREGHC